MRLSHWTALHHHLTIFEFDSSFHPRFTFVAAAYDVPRMVLIAPEYPVSYDRVIQAPMAAVLALEVSDDGFLSVGF